MDHYVEIAIRPDPEFESTQLMNALFAKLHRGLVEANSTSIGVSFPDHSARRLGDRLRLHGTAEALSTLMAQPWLSGMRDHVHVAAIAPVPPEVNQHRCVFRTQAKSNPERLRRRQIKRHGLSPEQAVEQIPDSAAETLKLPFLQVRSSSTGERFRLFVQHGTISQQPNPGTFSSYGLSRDATIPWWQ